MIRSSNVQAGPAFRSILRRLQYDNPNTQLLALQVLDICVKNGGNPFLVQVASKESSTELERLATGKASYDVRNRALKYIQDWATAFTAKDSLRHSELVRTYDKLRRESAEFPERDASATSAMVDSLSAPEWTDADYCTRCRTAFSLVNRKHHCRNCGQVFDQQCSSSFSPLPHYGITEPVRVCDGCVKKIKEGKGGVYAQTLAGAQAAKAATSATSAADKRHSRRDQEDEDMRRAIEASLQDAPPSAVGPDSAPRTQAKTRHVPEQAAVPDDDPDLAAAIAASLRDMPQQVPSAPDDMPEPEPYRNHSGLPDAPQPIQYAPLTSYDLSPGETDTLNAFHEMLRHPPPVMGTRERDMYEAAQRAAPRMERGMDDTRRRKEILMEMNDKLGEATRLYEGLLDRRVAAVSPGASPTTAEPPRRQLQPNYAPQMPAYNSAPPPMPAQPLPTSTLSTYATASPYASDQQASLPPQPAALYGYAQPYPAQAPAEAQPEQPHSPQEAQPPQQLYAPPQEHVPALQPAGWYTPSSFPAAPAGPILPSVPKQTPAKEEEPEKAQEQVGELIEL